MKSVDVESLKKQTWSQEDLKEYREYVNSIRGDEKNCLWEQRICNTALPCVARSCEKAKAISNAIYKGNYIEFLEKIKFEMHIDTLVYAYILNKIRGFDVFENYLFRFASSVDNWASCDALKYKHKDKQLLLKLSKKLLKSNFIFARRIGVNIMFEFIDEAHIKDIFDMLNSLKYEKEYYVNMSGAWLLCECFAKRRCDAIEFFKNNSTNDFIINKAISKCRDSFRISKEDKEMLKKFKRV